MHAWQISFQHILMRPFHIGTWKRGTHVPPRIDQCCRPGSARGGKARKEREKRRAADRCKGLASPSGRFPSGSQCPNPSRIKRSARQGTVRKTRWSTEHSPDARGKNALPLNGGLQRDPKQRVPDAIRRSSHSIQEPAAVVARVPQVEPETGNHGPDVALTARELR